MDLDAEIARNLSKKTAGRSRNSEQTKEDLRNYLAELFRAYDADGKDGDYSEDGEEPWQRIEELILNLKGDDPYTIMAKFIVTMNGEILRDLKSPVCDTRKQAEAALSALRLFDLEELYRTHCFWSDEL